MYTGMLEVKLDTRVLRKNGSFANRLTCCSLTALFRERKCLFIVATLLINKQAKIPSIVFFFVKIAVNR